MKNLSAAEIVRRLLDDGFSQPKGHTRLTDSKKRKSLNKDWNISGLTGKGRQSAKRAVEDIVRQGKTYNRDRAEIGPKDRLLLFRDMRQSLILDGLFPERKQKGFWLKLAERDRQGPNRELDLQDFSLLENPKDTLKSLREIAKAEATCLGAKINFKDSFCCDVTPFMILVECWKEMLPIFEGGEMDLPMQKVLASVGVDHALGIGLRGVSDFDDVWSFPLCRRRRPGSTESNSPYVDVPTRDFATDRFCDAMDEWLGRPEIGLKLSSQGRVHIMNLLGEVLENAERHSDGVRGDGSWSVSGFLARRKTDDGRWTYRASIGILSIGDTFSDSFERAHENQKTDINDYIRNVRTNGAVQSVATLCTLAALQDAVTCVEEADEANRGGYGLMDMLDFVCGLGHTDELEQMPQVTIISGSSCIRLKGAYNKGVTNPVIEHSPRVQWFNKENSANIPPEPEHVFDLDAHLPGTAISIGFSLDPTYLSKIFDNE